MGTFTRARALVITLATALVVSTLALAAPAASFADEAGQPAAGVGAITGHVQLDGGGNLAGENGWTWAFAIPVGAGDDSYGPNAHMSSEPIGADGAYQIASLPAGEYTVQTRWGCDCYPALRPHFDEFYGDAITAAGAAPVVVGAGATTTGIDISLESAASLTGTISPDSATVTVYQQTDTGWSIIPVSVEQQARWYAVGGLHTGVYAVGASAPGYCPKAPEGASPDERTVPVTVIAPASVVSDVTLSSAAQGCGPAVASAAPTISGTARFGETLTAVAGTWTTGAALSYQWLADGAPLTGQTSARLTLAATMVGKRISVAVTGSLSGYRTVSRVSATTAAVATAPLAAPVPTISGTVAVGSVLTAKPGSWTSATAFSYQWLANGKNISGATKSIFTVTAAQLTTKLTVRVTGSKAGYTTTAKTSSATAAVKPGTLKTAAPTISGTVVVGAKLTAKPGTWTSGTSYSYQWYADGKAISKATKSTYTVAGSLLAKKISVKVTGKKTGYATVSKTSKASAKAPKAGTPTISGTAAAGSKLTAKPGTWTSGTSYSYQWYADGKAISKATKSTFTVTGSQSGKAVTVKVTGKKSGYTTVAKTSAAKSRVPKVATPTISGTRAVTKTLTAKPGGWTTGTTFTYQWYADGKAISKATKSTLTLSTAHVGKKITVKVTGKKSGYTTVAKTSSATGKIGYPSRTAPSSLWNCPSWAPIKGNANSGIYHLPGQRFYTRTQPEECFRTESAARAAGYRKAKV